MRGDSGCRGVWGERDGCPDLHSKFSEMSEAAILLLHSPEAIDAQGHDGNVEILGEQADAGLKRDHAGGVAIVDDAFRENQHAVAAVGGVSREAEAFAKAGELRQRKHVEKSDE